MHARSIRLLVAPFLVLLLFAAPATAEIVSKIAAVVNDAIITTTQLDKAFREALSLNPAGKNLEGEEKEKLRRQVLDQLIEEELIKERVTQLRLKVADEDVEAAIQDVQRQNNLTREQLQAALEQQGMDFEVYRENLRKQILRFKLIGMEVQSKAEVTSAEVREYYRENLDDYRDAPYMHLSRLTFPIPEKADQEKIAEIRARAIEAHTRLEKGDGLSILLLSYATEGVSGGDMGKFAIGELSETFDREVRNLAPGEVSDIVEMPNGFFIFIMVDRSAGQAKPFEEVSGEIEQLLLAKKREQAFKDWSHSLRKNAYIDIRI